MQGGGEAFQEASLVDCVAFDKTGTLTQGGEPKVTDSEIFLDYKDHILTIANKLESASTHTLALAIRNFCEGTPSNVEIMTEEIEESGGKGIRGKMKMKGEAIEAIIRNEAWMQEHDAVYPVSSNHLETWKSQGKSVVIMAVRNIPSEKVPEGSEPVFQVVAQFAISDPIREEAPLVIRQLHMQGIATWMISGDNLTTAKAVAKMVGIREDRVIAGVLPNQKAEKIQWLQKTAGKRRKRHWWSRNTETIMTPGFQPEAKEDQRTIVAMVGDGINDAPALAISDLGIAIGSGSDIAIGSAKFILLSSNLFTILILFDLSKIVFRRIKINFFLVRLAMLLRC